MVMKRRNKISGQFSPRLIEMLESPAYRVLTNTAHRVISRIEIELGHHGGNDNGRLPVTYDNFIDYGVARMCIAPAVRGLPGLRHGSRTLTASPCCKALWRYCNAICAHCAVTSRA